MWRTFWVTERQKVGIRKIDLGVVCIIGVTNPEREGGVYCGNWRKKKCSRASGIVTWGGVQGVCVSSFPWSCHRPPKAVVPFTLPPAVRECFGFSLFLPALYCKASHAKTVNENSSCHGFCGSGIQEGWAGQFWFWASHEGVDRW